MPAMPGTMIWSSWRLPLTIAPNRARKIRGSRKLKKAALGLRQKRWRSKRYWRQSRATVSGIGGQLEVDLLEARPRHRETLEALAVRQRGAGQLGQQPGRVVGLLDHRLAPCDVGDAVARAAAD